VNPSRDALKTATRFPGNRQFHLNATAAVLVLLSMTLLMNRLAIYIRYRIRKAMR
jgi:ABC-type phosphate transport system permease subunit